MLSPSARMRAGAAAAAGPQASSKATAQLTSIAARPYPPLMSAPSHPLVQVDNVQLTLGSAAGPVNVLHGVSLSMAAGESVGLVGPSGSGKTTLLMILGGLERPNSGRVTIAGAELGTLGEDALARFRRDTIGIVFQSFHLVPTMTALENVAIPLELAGRRDAFARARECLVE